MPLDQEVLEANESMEDFGQIFFFDQVIDFSETPNRSILSCSLGLANHHSHHPSRLPKYTRGHQEVVKAGYSMYQGLYNLHLFGNMRDRLVFDWVVLRSISQW